MSEKKIMRFSLTICLILLIPLLGCSGYDGKEDIPTLKLKTDYIGEFQISSDDAYIVYEGRKGNTGGDLFLCSFETKDNNQLTKNGIYNYNPLWVSNKLIVYCSSSGISTSINVINIDNERSHAVKTFQNSVEEIALLESNKKLIATIKAKDNLSKLVTVNLENGKVKTLVGEAQLLTYPVVSPDERYIFFIGNLNDNLNFWISETKTWKTYSVFNEKEVKKIDMISFNYQGEPNSLQYAHFINPTWSPDGKEIAFGSPLQEIKVLDIENRKIKDPIIYGYHPAWSPNGDSIVFIDKKKLRKFTLKNSQVSDLTDVMEIGSLQWFNRSNRILLEYYEKPNIFHFIFPEAKSKIGILSIK